MSSLLNLLEEDSDEARSLQDEFEHLKSSLFSEIVQISWEATPSCDVDVMQYILEADYQEQKRYLEAILKVLETDGEGDIISRKLGLNTRKMLLGHSAWQGKVGAGAQTFAEVDVERDGMNVDVMDNHKRLLNTYSAIMGYLLRQDAVIWYFKNHNLPLCEEQVGIEAKFHLGLNDKEFSEAYNAIYLEFQTWNLAPGFTNDGFIVVNYDENINNDQFHQGMQKVFSKLKKNGIGNGMRKKKVFKFIGEYISNDWISYRNGEKYFDVVQDQMLWDWVVGIRNSRIDAVNTEFQERRDKEKLLHQ